jgi:hypothetical protein
VSLDAEYVEFIKTRCEGLYFTELGRYVGPHYDNLLQLRAYSQEQFGRNFVAEWHAYLLERIRSLASQAETLIVEGYLLYDCVEALTGGLGDLATVFHVVVHNGRYIWQHRLLTVEQVAALGTSEGT